MNSSEPHPGTPNGRPRRSRRGLAMGALAFGSWGFFPLYFPLLKPVGALEILALRIVWSTVSIVVIVTALRGWGAVASALRHYRQALAISGAAFVLAANWLLYIISVNSGHVVQASLGYFINPLLSVVIGVVLLHESLRRMQWAAIGIASGAIVVLTVAYGTIPWYALALASSFAVYGFIKKWAGIAPVAAMAIECFALLGPSVAFEVALLASGQAQAFTHGMGTAILIAGTGPITVIPLMMFAQAANDLPLSIVGMLQYITPVIQFVLGVWVAHESMPAARYIGFGLVWIALIVLTVDGMRWRQRATVDSTTDPLPLRNSNAAT